MSIATRKRNIRKFKEKRSSARRVDPDWGKEGRRGTYSRIPLKPVETAEQFLKRVPVHDPRKEEKG